MEAETLGSPHTARANDSDEIDLGPEAELYRKSAALYDALYEFKDYVAASKALHGLIQRVHPGARRLLDVGCGTGLHLEQLQQWYEAEGVDINGEMLAVAASRLPGVQLHEQDMTTLALDQRYDVITCLFSAIAYVRTADQMNHAIARFAAHLAPGGLLVVEPFFSPEQYWTDRVTLNVTERDDLKIAWMYSSPPPKGGIAVLDIHYLVGTPQSVDHFTERHEMGLFTHEQYADAFAAAGMEATLDETGFFGRGAWIARPFAEPSG